MGSHDLDRKKPRRVAPERRARILHVRMAIDGLAMRAPQDLAPALDSFVRRSREVGIDAAVVVGALRACTEALPSAGTDAMHELVHDLEEALRTTDVPAFGVCGLGPAVLALVTHLTGRAPHHRPDALGATSATAEAATAVLGWSRSGEPVERLVAALTASDPAALAPLVDDEHRLIRIAAAANRCHRPDGRTASYGEPDDEREDDPVCGRAAFTLLRVELGEAGLAVPDLARRFAEAGLLIRLDRWRTATSAWPLPFQDYLFSEPVRRLQGPVPQQLAINHAGHGLNSYGLNLRVAVGPVAVMGQVGWGGAYGGDADDERWRVLAEGVDLLTHGIALTEHGRLEQRRWLVVHSDFRLGPMPTLLRFDGSRWRLPDDVLDQPETSRGREPRRMPTIEELEDRWTQIHNVVEQDLLTFERDWSADLEELGGRLVIPSPDDAADDLRVVLDVDGRVTHVEYDSDEGLLVRRGGIWIRAEELPDDSLTEVLLRSFTERVPIPAEAVPSVDVATTIGIRPQVAALGVEPG